MFGKLKKILVLIPCMILGLFLLNSVKVNAATGYVASDYETIQIGEESSKDNIYYFISGNVLTIKLKDVETGWGTGGDKTLKYRVLSPEGKVTKWSEKIDYRTTCEIVIDLTNLNYRDPKSDDENIANRNTVAPKSTYFIDIDYYTWFGIDQNKDETIKVIRYDSSKAKEYLPVITHAYDSVNNKYNLKADTNGTGIIKSVKYFASATKQEPATYSDFDLATAAEFKVGEETTFSINKPAGESKYLYVAAQTGTETWSYIEIELPTDTKGDDGGGKDTDDTPPLDDESKSHGLLDYEFGEFILLVLVVVLIVSCALIITQKIVDYKKRLY